MPATRRRFLTSLAALAALPAAAREGLPLMLAHEAGPGLDPAGFLVSEKYDGARALWDGRTLRFRSGRPVAAPAEFLARLPATPLDGELWAGRGRFEALAGTVRKQVPDDAEWRAVRYMVFDLPGDSGTFAERAARIAALLPAAADSPLVAVAQSPVADAKALARRLDAVVRAGGEGLVLHRAGAHWHAGRSDDLLKLKPLADAEAVVVGHVPGRGKYAGRLGALRVRADDGREFLVGTGFSDAQRAHPPAPGRTVTFTYQGRTAAGVPRFASFLRERDL